MLSEWTRVILLLVFVLGLQGADLGTVGAVAATLEQSLHVSHAQVGALVAVTLGVGALATLPIGILVDQLRRTTLLAGSVTPWALATAASGASVDYLMLLRAHMRFAMPIVLFPGTLNAAERLTLSIKQVGELNETGHSHLCRSRHVDDIGALSPCSDSASLPVHSGF